ncbi:MAG: FKBP-type peptidyl-prolyl cis-trans isomerase [Flavobacteriales bacterium]|nr:MAG: FKBP-type peptidyl-prolyl cis-trans isomerase [Flavobacteriales bacterium]
MRCRPVLVLSAIVALIGCGDGKYPGFKQAAPGIWFKLHALGDGTAAPITGDSALMRLRISLPGQPPGSLYSSERYFLVDRARGFDGAMLTRMNEGDSVSVKVLAGAFPWKQWIGSVVPAPTDSTTLEVEMSLLDIMDMFEQRSTGRYVAMAGTDSTEQALLLAYSDSTDWVRWGSSLLFYRLNDPGYDSATIKTGDLVTIRLLGRFLDGHVFDEGAVQAPMTFVLGDPDQVIKGVEVAVHLLHLGSSGEFIIPSSMAFGPEGSSSGIVPAWTPVRYTVEVTEVVPKGAPAQ